MQRELEYGVMEVPGPDHHLVRLVGRLLRVAVVECLYTRTLVKLFMAKKRFFFKVRFLLNLFCSLDILEGPYYMHTRIILRV